MTRTAEQPAAALIRLETSRPTTAPPDHPLEPVFLFAPGGPLHPDAQGRTDAAKTYFSHAVARNPADLRAHTRRILLHIESEDPAIIGPLCDLFLALDGAGTPLRRRMLSLAAPLLNGSDRQMLLQLIEHPQGDLTPLHTRSPAAVLSDGHTGSTALLEREDLKAAGHEDPLETARDQLECGQTTLAMETLEQALLADSGRLALHHALLEIYRHARDLQRAEQMWQRLPERLNPASADWQHLMKQLTRAD